jgi:GDP-L-fucose synthase
MEDSSRIYIAGHRGLVGSAIERRCRALGFGNLLLRTRQELDLGDQRAVDQFFDITRPEYVFLAAAHVGGIHASARYPADFILNNLVITTHVVDAARRYGTSKLLFLGSSCMYPRSAPQPMREEYLLTGLLEPTNESYSIAKLAGLKLCQAFRAQYGFDAITALPTNIYGPGDNFDPDRSHVVPALIRKIDSATTSGSKTVLLWGTGRPRRELLHVDDLADACVFLMQHYSDTAPVNVGCGEDHSIQDIAMIIARIIGFEGQFNFDATQPDGMPRKLLDVSRLAALGWHQRTDLETGLRATWTWYRQTQIYPTV